MSLLTSLKDSPPTRGLATMALTEFANVISGTVVDDGGGGGTTGYATGGTIACRVDTLGGSEQELANRISDRSTHLVTLPAGTNIAPANSLAIAGRGTFEVTAVQEHSNEPVRFVEVVLRS